MGNIGNPPKRPRTLSSSNVSPPIIDSSSEKFFRIPKDLACCLNEFFDTDVILYKRKALLEELEFLETRVINEAKTGWI